MKIKRILFITVLWIFSIVLFSNSVNAQPYLTENSTWQQNLTGVQWSSLAWGDVDNDGDLDLALTGCTHVSSSCDSYLSKIYINNGTSLIENSTWQQNLTDLNRGSLAWGDVDNDGDLDLALTGCSSGGGTSICNTYEAFIYINNDTSLIENSTWENNLTEVAWSSLAWGDVDNDGDLDLALTGWSENGKISKIYINNDTSLIENSTWENNLTGVDIGSLAWGDVDNDGDLDLVLSGRKADSTSLGKIYINNGTSLIENSTWQQNLVSLIWSSVILGDYDNDSDLDLALIGHTTIDNHRVYGNNGTTLIEVQNQTYDFLGIYDGSIAFGDYDNDGYLDMVATGSEGYTIIYRYNNSGPFTAYTKDMENLLDLERGSDIAWGDVDNDGDLDLVLSGWYQSDGEKKAKIYINNISTPNTAPNPPTNNFSSSYTNGKLILSWGNGSDTETNTSGLYYNLRVGTCSACHDIVSGVYGGSSNPTAGYFGNMMQRKSITLNIPNIQPDQTYYWSVQTIDTGLAKSSWSDEQNYTTPSDVTKPTIVLDSPVDNYNTTNPTISFNTVVYDDSNLTNVSLWGSWGGWHLNETNSSGINNTEYIFTKNLTGYGDGDYTWQIKAYDNSSNYALSSIRTFTIDTKPPVIDLISPTHTSTWSSSNTVTFTYNVSDVRIVNCSLIIDGIVDQTNPSITVNVEQSFTKSLSNGNYNWSINCTDTVGYVNSSLTRTFTVSYTPPTDGGSTSPDFGTPSTNITAEKLTKTYTSIIPFSPKTITAADLEKSGTDLIEIYISVKARATSVKITIEKLSELPIDIEEELTGKIYQHINITKENLEDENIDKATIKFKVNKSWIADNTIDPEKISLNRYEDRWNRLNTTKLSEDMKCVYYEAETPGFSYFAITGGELITSECPSCPNPSNWSGCTDSKQNRTNYLCSEETGYECQAYTEERDCTVTSSLDLTIPIIITAIIVVVVLIWKFKTYSR